MFTIEKSNNNLFEGEAEPVDFQGSDRETKGGSKKIKESKVVTRRNSNTNLVFFFRQIQGMTGNICRVKYFMDLEE